jgi:hypothetical protein
MDKKTQECWRIKWGSHACVDVVLMSSKYLHHLTYNHVPNPKTQNLKGHAHLHGPTYNPTPLKIMDWNPHKIMNRIPTQQNNALEFPFFSYGIVTKCLIQKNTIHMYVEMMFVTSHLVGVSGITLIGNVHTVVI